MNANQVSNLVMSQFVYGTLPELAETDDLRYFIAKDEKTYFYIKDKALYDYSGRELVVKADVRYRKRNGLPDRPGDSRPRRSLLRDR